MGLYVPARAHIRSALSRPRTQRDCGSVCPLLPISSLDLAASPGGNVEAMAERRVRRACARGEEQGGSAEPGVLLLPFFLVCAGCARSFARCVGLLECSLSSNYPCSCTDVFRLKTRDSRPKSKTTTSRAKQNVSYQVPGTYHTHGVRYY